MLFRVRESIFLLTQLLRDNHQVIREFINVIDLKEKQATYDIVIWVLGLPQTLLHCVGGWVNSVIVDALDSFSAGFISIWKGYDKMSLTKQTIKYHDSLEYARDCKVRIWRKVHARSNIVTDAKNAGVSVLQGRFLYTFSIENSLKRLKENVYHSI